MRRSLPAMALACCVVASGCDGDPGASEQADSLPPDVSGWLRVEAMVARAHDVPSSQERSFNPRSPGHRTPEMRFRQYLYEWKGLRVGTELSGPSEGEPARVTWQEPWIEKFSLDVATFDGDFEALAESQGAARRAHERFARAFEDGRVPCLGLSPISPREEIDACVRLRACVGGYGRVELRIDPDDPRRLTATQPTTPADPNGALRRFEPWRVLGASSLDELCEARSEPGAESEAKWDQRP